jgi:organic hydroperoxide reductase OsmC/OhrA
MSEPKVFYYETGIDWTKEKEGQIKGPTLPTVNVGAPPEFKGREGQWTPEHLFVASVNGCFMLTLLAVAENSKVPLFSYSSTARGKLEKVQGAGFQITEIIIKPTVVIRSAQDLARVPRILEKAKENCFVTNSIKSVVKLEPQVYHQQIQTSPCPLGEAPDSASASTSKNRD